MARHLRRLTLWFLAGLATLLLLALCALAALWWFLDPNDYRAQIEARATVAIGRPVHLTGELRWQLGRQIFIVSEGGDIANAAGFGPQPLARWSRIRLGVAARPLLKKRVLIDRVEIDALQLQLQRNAQGAVNWKLQLAAGNDDPAAQSVAVRIAAVVLRGSAVRFQDAVSGADWRVTNLAASAKLPDDLSAKDREFRDIEMAARVAGGPLAAEGVAFSLRTKALRLSPQLLQIPDFTLQWADATLTGGATVLPGAAPELTATLNLQTPSLRALLATAGVTPPPMRDGTTLGKLQLTTSLRHAGGATTLDQLSIALDDTRLTGSLSVPQLKPLVLRFDLAADSINMDRYREPDDVNSEPFELPLVWLKALDAKGVLNIRQATVAGAAAKEVRIDVE
ncbi:MAG: AsmA family protein [Steroidobacteraceae bacterium]